MQAWDPQKVRAGYAGVDSGYCTPKRVLEVRLQHNTHMPAKKQDLCHEKNKERRKKPQEGAFFMFQDWAGCPSFGEGASFLGPHFD